MPNKATPQFPGEAALAYGRILGMCMATDWTSLGVEQRLEVKVQTELLDLLAALGWMWREGRFQKREEANDATT